MKKKELLKRIEALEKQFDILSDEVMDLEVEKQLQPHPTAEKFKAIADHANAINDVIQNAPKDETIYVPDGILGVSMLILNGNQSLSVEHGSWEVLFSSKGWTPSTPNQFKLVPLNREDLKAGDVAFVYLNEYSIDIKYEVSNLENYMIVTNKGLVYWDCSSGGISVINNKLNGNHVWYKVVES